MFLTKRRVILLLFFLFSLWSNANCILFTKFKSDSLLFTPRLFDHKEPLEITLEFDIKRFKKEKSDSIYLPAKIYYKSSEAKQIIKEVRIKARGESRKRHCNLAPFWLNVKYASILHDSISESNKFKIVTDCRDGRIYEKYLFNEFLIYKIYNIITDNSFKVRLLRIKYIDSGKNQKVDMSWAFMIEPENMLASRINALPIKFDNLNYNHTDSLAADIMCFFQYMIGNTDFTVNGRHNVKLFKYIDYLKPDLITIPYDFDFAGLINADYAKPAEVLPIENVTIRYYLGMCRGDEQYLKVMNIFREKEDEIYELVESFEYLSKLDRNATINYLDEFYKELNKPNFIKRNLKSTCR